MWVLLINNWMFLSPRGGEGLSHLLKVTVEVTAVMHLPPTFSLPFSANIRPSRNALKRFLTVWKLSFLIMQGSGYLMVGITHLSWLSSSFEQVFPHHSVGFHFLASCATLTCCVPAEYFQNQVCSSIGCIANHESHVIRSLLLQLAK